MDKLTEAEVNNILNEIHDVIYDDNLPDFKAIDEIMLILEKYKAKLDEISYKL